MNPTKQHWTKTTEWTESGHRLKAGVGADAAYYVMCQSQSLVVRNGKVERQEWNLSQICVPIGNRRDDAERVVGHWLAFYGDAQLVQLGLSLTREAFDSAELCEPATGGGITQAVVN